MMNVIAPTIECNSGCESGWTLYLEHSTSNNISLTYKNTSFRGKNLTNFDEKQAHNNKDVLFDAQEDEEKEEDLSMVSDASSGPPHFDHHNIDEELEENNFYYCNNNNNNNNGNKKRNMTLYGYEMQCCSSNNKADDFALDDTASSHVFASNKEIGGIRVQKHRGASLERLIDYSSQGYSGTHAQVVLEKRKSRG